MARLSRLPQIAFIPMLMIVILLSMYTRATEVLHAVEEGTVSGLFSPAPAIAESATPPAEPKQDKVGDTAEKPADAPAAPAVEAPKRAAPTDFENLTSDDYQVLQQLAGRRAELDKRTEDLQQREALLQAAEKRLEEKVAQLQQSRAELEKLLGQANDQQSEQIKSLVKIYETMKPAQAAKIFEQLDMPVLLQVIQQMKEAKAAPVLAAMDPAKAKAVTTELMQKKELPQPPKL